MNGINGARSALAVGTLVVLATGGAIFARGNGKTSSNQLSDEAFAKKADQGDLAEVKLAQLAETKSQNPTVRAFAQRMIHDHTQANDRLQGVASAENVNLPAQPDSAQQQTYDRLSKLNGRAFDRAYARDMVKDHEHDIAAFKKEAEDGSNPQIKQFAQSTLPILQEHLSLARNMYQKVDGNAASVNDSAKNAVSDPVASGDPGPGASGAQNGGGTGAGGGSNGGAAPNGGGTGNGGTTGGNGGNGGSTGNGGTTGGNGGNGGSTGNGGTTGGNGGNGGSTGNGGTTGGNGGNGGGTTGGTGGGSTPR